MGNNNRFPLPARVDSFLRTGIVLIIVTASVFHSVQAQNYEETKYRQIMNEGVKLMETGNYREADGKFKQVLRNLNVLPSEICFYFGKNSYFLEEYKQSINWLNKYIELKGTQGQFFDESVAYMNRSEKAYELQREKDVSRVAEEFSIKNEFDCEGHDFFQCPLCKGEGVLLKPGKLDNIIYETCPFCEGTGRLSCEDYKKYLKGELTTTE